MNLKTIQIVLDNNGNLIDKSYQPIISHSNYSYILQVISPVLSTSSVDVTISTNNNINISKTTRLRLAKNNGIYLKGSDVIDNRKSYYNIVQDYNVWETEIQGTLLSIINKTNSTKAILSITINESVIDPNATNYLGTFGSNSDTILDIPLPTTENVGDYYVCNVLNFNSINLNQEFRYKDIVIYDGTKWYKGINFILKQKIQSLSLTIEPALSYIYEELDDTLTDDIILSISYLDGSVKTNQNNITNNTNDITSLKTEVTGKEDRLPLRTSLDSGKYLKVNNNGDIYYEDVPISTEEFQEDILNINQELDTKSNINHNHDTTYEPIIIKNTAFNKNFTEATYTDIDTGLVVNENNGISEIIPRSDHLHDDRYYTETEIDTKLSDIANASHTHDDIYYTETEVDTLLSNKSDNTHNHNTLYKDINYNPITQTILSLNTTTAPSEDTIYNALLNKSDTTHLHDDRYYTETEVDTKLSNKSDTTHTHLKSDITDFTHTHIESDITDLDKYTKLEVDTKLSNKSNTTHTHDDRYYTETETNTLLNNKSDTGHTHSYIPTSEKGVADGVAELDTNGYIPSSQLPPYVDDILEYNGTLNFPTTGETGKIYVDTSTNLTYRWSGTQYTEISKSLALGETSSTAYRGDRGKIAYDHSQTSHDYASSTHLHDDRYYTETEIDTKLSNKSDTTHTHDDRYYTETEIDTKLSNKSDTTHLHDDRYYTETETNTLLNNKSDTGHTHLKTDITDFTHTHDYLSSSGGTLTGPLTISETGVTKLILKRTGTTTNNNIEFNINDTTIKYLGINGTGDLLYGSSADLNSLGTKISLDGHTHSEYLTSYTDTNDYVDSLTGSGNGTLTLGRTGSLIDLTLNLAHTHDDRYYTETETNTLLSNKSDTGHTHSYIPTSEKGVADGVATLGADGLVPSSQLPASSSGGSSTELVGLYYGAETGYPESVIWNISKDYTASPWGLKYTWESTGGDDRIGFYSSGTEKAYVSLDTGTIGGSKLILQGSATGASNVAYVQFNDSAGMRKGYIGDDATADNDITLVSEAGAVNIHGSSSWNRMTTSSGYIEFGPANTSYAHIYTDRPSFYFNKDIYISGTKVSKDGHTHDYASSTHNHTYNVNDAWLRENGDDGYVKLYGNTRTMVFRTDGTTQYSSNGAYPFIWLYGGDATTNRRMLLNSSGQLWLSNYGWLHDKFALSGHTHSIKSLWSGATAVSSSTTSFTMNDSVSNYTMIGVEWSYNTSTNYVRSVSYLRLGSLASDSSAHYVGGVSYATTSGARVYWFQVWKYSDTVLKIGNVYYNYSTSTSAYADDITIYGVYGMK